MTSEVMKLELEAESCCVCGNNNTELFTPEEHDVDAPMGQIPLRAMLLQLSNTKVVPEGRLCASCIRRTLEAYEFSNTLSSRGVLPLSEKIRSLRRRLHELTQKIDVFIVVGGPGMTSGSAYSEEDIIMVDKTALAAAAKADDEDLEKARNARGDTVYQCTVCPESFQRVSEYRSHCASHGSDALHCCWTCGAQFSTRAALRDHSEQHSTAHALHCHLCDSSFQSQSALRRHESTCPAVCPACGVKNPDRNALSKHASQAHGPHVAPPHVCSVCFRLYADRDLLAAHLLRHRQASQFVCGYDACILRFPDRNSLMAHIRKSHASEVPINNDPQSPSGQQLQDATLSTACYYCPRTFGSVAAMKRHARVHRNIKEEDKGSLTEDEQMEMDGEMEGEVEYLEVEELEEIDDRDNESYEQKPNIHQML